MKPNYLEHKIANGIKSWCIACAIPCQVNVNPVKVEISDPNGNVQTLYHTQDFDGTPIAKTDLAKGLEVFWYILEKCGWNKCTPVNRPIKNNRAKSSEKPEWVRLRHKEYRISPDTPKAYLKESNRIIKVISKRFYQMNSTRLKELQYEIGDLYSYGAIYAAIFNHRYRLVGVSEDQNSKLLNSYLMQRYTELIKNLIIDHKKMSLAKKLENEPKIEDELLDYEEELERLPHNEMILRFNKAMPLLDIETKKVANNYMKKHQLTCLKCKGRPWQD